MHRHRQFKFKGLHLFLALAMINTDVVFAAKPTRSHSLANRMADCTRIDILFKQSALELLCSIDTPVTLFSAKEQTYLKSMKKVVCNDKQLIGRFSHDLRFGTHDGSGPGRMKFSTRIVGYKNDEKILSFQIGMGALLTESNDFYVFGRGFPTLPHLLAELRPYKMRAACAYTLLGLGLELLDLLEIGAFPQACEWCDIIARRKHSMGFLAKEPRRSDFECPGAQTSHYAMNTHCTANSPSGTVLLFESKPGWNQHGGPELFTVENHEPRGGLVILNDEDLTVKFVRSHEELRKLRWK